LSALIWVAAREVVRMAVMNCPKCQGRLRVPDNIPARKVKCPACGTVFAVGGDATPAPGPGPRGGPERPAKPSDLLSRQGQDYEVLDDEPPPTPRRPRDDRDDDFDDRPRRRRRPDYDDYEDDYDDRPRRRDDRPGRPSRQLDPG